MPKMVNLRVFRKPEACGQTMIPDKSIQIVQKLLENAKIENSNETFWIIFKECGVAGVSTGPVLRIFKIMS